VVFTRQRVAVFIDGCFWHSCPEHGTLPKANRSYWKGKLQENVERDRRIVAELELSGWSVLRIWAHTPPAEGADQIEVAINGRLES
jgi:DNA mismatch endonuclease (patch repair protein)